MLLQNNKSRIKTRGKISVMHGLADAANTIDPFADLAKEPKPAGVAHDLTIVYFFEILTGSRPGAEILRRSSNDPSCR